MLKKAHLNVKGASVGGLLRRYLVPGHLKSVLKWRGTSGIRQLLCCVRKFQKLELYARCFLLISVAIILITVFHVYPLQFSPGWVLPDTCVKKDCKLSDPLPLSKLSPNLLLVLIHASAGGRDKRDVIRDTWLSGMSNKDNSPIQYRFILGGHKISAAAMKEVMDEALEHNDILVFPTVTDSLTSLTNRTLFSFVYAYESFNFKYTVKCDDDSFIDLPRIATELQLRQSTKPLYWGYMVGSAHIFTYGRYAEFNWSVCDLYFPYALGGGYVLSREVVRILATHWRHLKFYISEDVSIGAWLAPYNIEYKHDARFNVNSPSRGCKDPYLITHKVSVERMVAYQESMLLEGRICSWRTYSYGVSGYIFNWSTPLDKSCCKRNSFVP